MNLFAQLIKVDEEHRLVYGRIAQEVTDHSGETMDYATSKPNFEKWSSSMSLASGGKNLGNIRAMHGNVAVGKAVELSYHDDENAIDIVGKIIDDNEWEKVLEGVYTGFSIGGKYGNRWNADGLKRYEAVPNEVSLVDRPCIPTATFFDVRKLDGTLQKVAFKSADEVTKPGSKEVSCDYMVDGTQDDLKELGKLMTDNELTLQDVIAATKPLTVSKFLTSIGYGTTDVTMLGTAGALELCELEKVSAGSEEGKKKYGDVKFADPKNNKYPIENEAHIRAAWVYINKEKNAAKYSEEDLAAIRKRIIAAWKDKIDSSGPPSAAKSDTNSTNNEVGAMEKSIYDVTRLAEVLQSLTYIVQNCCAEAEREMDGSHVPAKLTDIAMSLGEVLKELVVEEVDELKTVLLDAQPVVDAPLLMAEGALNDLEKNLVKDKGGLEDSMNGQTDLLQKIMTQNEELLKLVAESQDRLSKLEALPLPAVGALRVVGKGDELDVVEPPEVVVYKVDGTVDPVATAIKKAHALGGVSYLAKF